MSGLKRVDQMSAVCNMRPFAPVVWQEVEQEDPFASCLVRAQSKHTSQSCEPHSILKTVTPQHHLPCCVLLPLPVRHDYSGPSHCDLFETIGVSELKSSQSRKCQERRWRSLLLRESEARMAFKSIPGSLSQHNPGSYHDDTEVSCLHQV